MSSITRVTFMRPDWDIVTASGSYWMQAVVDFARQRGINFGDLQGNDATLHQLQREILSRNPQLFYGVGHGLAHIITGQNEEIVLSKDNARIMKDRIVHLLSCQTAKQLGPELIRAGAKVYVGYDVDFYAVLGLDPRVDSLYTRALFEPDITLALNLLSGLPPAKAYEESQAVSDEWIEYFRNSDDPHDDLLIRALISNKNHLVILTSTTRIQNKPQLLAVSLPLVALGIAAIFAWRSKG